MQRSTVAIVDAHRDTVEMLSGLLSGSGFQGVEGPAHASAVDFVGYMARYDPEALIWDIPPPVHRNWAFFKLLRHIGPLHDRAIVLTTTDRVALDALVSQDPTTGLEVLGKPYQPELMLAAVKRAIEAQRAHSTTSCPFDATYGPRVLPGIAQISSTPTLH
jgi:FixJ family two-component response regulator